jgi:hypothetical protein
LLSGWRANATSASGKKDCHPAACGEGGETCAGEGSDSSTGQGGDSGAHGGQGGGSGCGGQDDRYRHCETCDHHWNSKSGGPDYDDNHRRDPCRIPHGGSSSHDGCIEHGYLNRAAGDIDSLDCPKRLEFRQ